ncbi:hypothetical protein AB0D49_25520 [Streptomyces sp. NPDC048290]|uniref:hypothetical protein n=1 Tax=Streptomyces sp. NPDC048290 TaxID=3155811 RepID=UPI0034250B8D
MNASYSSGEGKESDKKDSASPDLLNCRTSVLEALALTKLRLKLVLADWGGAVRAEREREDPRPPVIVVSSSRSEWIAERIKRLERAGPFEGIGDMSAFDWAVAPLYSPSRLGNDRGVYVVVHESEYWDYRNAFNEQGINDVTIVGWRFPSVGGVGAAKSVTVKEKVKGAEAHPVTTGGSELVGFGATRFAAIEFCKQMRQRVGAAVWDTAWLLDDNVVALAGLDSLDGVEGELGENICAGFQAGTVALEEPDVINQSRRWKKPETGNETTGASGKGAEKGATGGVDKKSGKGATGGVGKKSGKGATGGTKKEGDGEASNIGGLVKEGSPGLIQQAVLWNIGKLEQLRLNFCPAFIASAEDVSFVNYLKRRKIPLVQYKGISVKKAAVESSAAASSADGAANLRSAVQSLIKTVAEYESTKGGQGGVMATGMPPVMIDGRTVSDAVEAWWGSGSKESKSDEFKDKAKCQVLEQAAAANIAPVGLPSSSAEENSPKKSEKKNTSAETYPDTPFDVFFAIPLKRTGGKEVQANEVECVGASVPQGATP